MSLDHAITDDGELVHLALLASTKPVKFQEALKQKVWLQAMKEELGSIEINKTLDLISLPLGKTPIAVKWVFKVKLNPDGNISKHKARPVSKGFMQKEGEDYSEIFAPLARFETVRMIVGLACWRSSRSSRICLELFALILCSFFFLLNTVLE